MNFNPTFNNIIVELPEKETTSQTGLILSVKLTEDAPDRGKVVAVGEGKHKDGTLFKLPFEIGQNVLFAHHSGQNVKVQGKEYLILKEIDILAIIE